MDYTAQPTRDSIKVELVDAFATSDDFVTAEELLKRGYEKIPCLIDPFLPKVGIASIVGGSDVGKSTFLRQLVIAVVIGMSHLLGYLLNATHKSASYISTEDDESSIAYLLGIMPQVKANHPAAFQKLRFIFESDGLLEKLDRMLVNAPADLVVIDVFGDLYGGRTNKSSQVKLFLNDYLEVAKKYKCLIIFLHHTGKYKDELAPSKHHILGSQAFKAKMRVVLGLYADNHDANLRHLCVLKGNYLPASYKQDRYVLWLDADRQFKATNDRVPLDQLAKPRESSPSNGGYNLEKYEKAEELKTSGNSYQDIADALGYANKSYVTKLFKKFDSHDN